MIKINVSGLAKSLFNKKILEVKTYLIVINFKELDYFNNFPEEKNNKNIEILTVNINNLSSKNISINTFNHEDMDIIFYSFVQDLSIGININSKFQIIERKSYISDNFKMLSKNTDFEVNPINVQTNIIDNQIYISVSYSITINKDDNNLNIKKSFVQSTTEKLINTNFSNFNYIDINKEFL